MAIYKIQTFLNNNLLLKEENIFLIAFSGGADSLCLLDCIYNLSLQYGFKVKAAHLNHGWRRESDDEEIKAREYCNNRNIEFFTEKLPAGTPKTELEARDRRYEFLNRIALKVKATGLFTGHTITDQAETILYRIIKGTGVHGLTGIPQSRPQANGITIYRPMMNISRQETLDYCKNNNLSPSFDSSNEDISYFRNRIRLNLIPELKNYNEEVESALIRLALISQDTEELVKEYLTEKEKIYFINKEELHLQIFLEASLALKRRIIYQFLIKNNLEYDFERIEKILHFIEKSKTRKSGDTLSIAKEKWIFCSKEKLKIIGSVRSTVIKSAVEVNLKDKVSFLGKTLEINEWEQGKPFTYSKEKDYNALVDLNEVKTPLFIRTRQAGDRIQPFGMKEKVKLKKYIINKGIPEHERDSLLLLTNEEEVLWVIGVGISELLRVKNSPTHKLEVY
ncbi:MAG: tRNA lysidine(34) synthetase TilS [bacterium]